MEQRHLGDEIAHAVGYNGDFRLACFVGIIHKGGLISEKNFVEGVEHPREVIGASARPVATDQD
jgi:hypothetical protein